jgi:hypothetical protein
VPVDREAADEAGRACVNTVFGVGLRGVADPAESLEPHPNAGREQSNRMARATAARLMLAPFRRPSKVTELTAASTRLEYQATCKGRRRAQKCRPSIRDIWSSRWSRLAHCRLVATKARGDNRAGDGGVGRRTTVDLQSRRIPDGSRECIVGGLGGEVSVEWKGGGVLGLPGEGV